MTRAIRVMVSAGELSGDSHAAALLGNLRNLGHDLEAFGLGGDGLVKAGLELLCHQRDVSVTGVGEVFRMLPRLLRAYRSLLRALRERKPHLLLLVDYPGMNMRLACHARKMGVPVVYYVVPQVWAWRAGRAKLLARDTALCLCIFQFEEEFLRSRGVPTKFVGHPLLDDPWFRDGFPDGARARSTLALHLERPVVAVLPGSRKTEIEHHLKPFVGACRWLADRRPETQFVLPAAQEGWRAWLTDLVRSHGGDDLDLRVVGGASRQVLAAADVALTKSGTSTLEAALSGTSMVIAYRMAASSYWLAKRLVRVPHIGMANIVAGKRLFPELLQKEVTSEKLGMNLLRMLESPVSRESFLTIRQRLGGAGTARRAAEEIAEVLLSTPFYQRARPNS